MKTIESPHYSITIHNSAGEINVELFFKGAQNLVDATKIWEKFSVEIAEDLSDSNVDVAAFIIEGDQQSEDGFFIFLEPSDSGESLDDDFFDDGVEELNFDE